MNRRQQVEEDELLLGLRPAAAFDPTDTTQGQWPISKQHRGFGGVIWFDMDPECDCDCCDHEGRG